jgi:hypothetical protein
MFFLINSGIKPKTPLVLWPGFGQFSQKLGNDSRTDGMDFKTISQTQIGVYLIDQPRRGNAGRSMAEATIQPTTDEQEWFSTIQVGIWPDFFEGVQFAKSDDTLNP